MAYHPYSETLLVPMSDLPALPGDGDPQPGMYGIDVRDGTIRWQHTRENRCEKRECFGGLSSAIVSGNDIVVSGSLDGFLEVRSVMDGRLLYSFDSWQEYETVNDIPASGGAFDTHGPMLADNLVVVASGYGSFSGKPGNALLVFEVQP